MHGYLTASHQENKKNTNLEYLIRLFSSNQLMPDLHICLVYICILMHDYLTASQ